MYLVTSDVVEVKQLEQKRDRVKPATLSVALSSMDNRQSGFGGFLNGDDDRPCESHSRSLGSDLTIIISARFCAAETNMTRAIVTRISLLISAEFLLEPGRPAH